MSQAGGSLQRCPSLSPASGGPPGTTRCQRPGAERAGGQRPRCPSSSSCLFLAPSPCPSPGPHLHGHLIFCSRFAGCTRRELSTGGWFFGFCFLFVYLFNLMICKVMFLFLFYTFQLIFNLCLESDSCNCTFFCLLTRINDDFVLGGVHGAAYFPWVVWDARRPRDSGHRHPRHNGQREAPAQSEHTRNGPLQRRQPPNACLQPPTSSSGDFHVSPALSQLLLARSVQEVCVGSCPAAPTCAEGPPVVRDCTCSQRWAGTVPDLQSPGLPLECFSLGVESAGFLGEASPSLSWPLPAHPHPPHFRAARPPWPAAVALEP